MKAAKSKNWKNVGLVVAVVLVASSLAYLRPFGPDETAKTAMLGGNGVNVNVTTKWIHFEPTGTEGSNWDSSEARGNGVGGNSESDGRDGDGGNSGDDGRDGDGGNNGSDSRDGDGGYSGRSNDTSRINHTSSIDQTIKSDTMSTTDKTSPAKDSGYTSNNGYASPTSYKYGIIFYPGTLVKAESYAPLARELALYGYDTFLLRMPFNLAVTDVERATSVLKSFPDGDYVIGGHSFGGTMAARYADRHPQRVSGLFLLGSFVEDKVNLTNSTLPVLSITASNDEIIKQEIYEAKKKNFPVHTTYYTIQGGNHGQFGNYGLRRLDGMPTISAEEQMEITVAEIIRWMDQIGG